MALDEENGGGASDLLGGAGGDSGGSGGAEGGEGKSGDAGGEGAGGEGAGDKGAALPDWFEKLSAETKEGEKSSHRDYAQAKGFKDLDSVFTSLREAEKAIHEKGRIAVPKDGAKPEEVAAFRSAIGVPENADGYEIKAPDGVPLNEPLIASLRASAIKHGAPKGAFEGLVSDFMQLQLDEAAAEAKRQDQLAADKVKEWGGKKTENLAHVDAAAAALGFSKADMAGLRSGLGADRALDLLAKLGSGMAEDTLITGGKGRFGVTPAEAQAEIDKLKLDPEFGKKAQVKGSPENIRWDRLNQAAAEGKAAAEAKL